MIREETKSNKMKGECEKKYSYCSFLINIEEIVLTSSLQNSIFNQNDVVRCLLTFLWLMRPETCKIILERIF